MADDWNEEDEQEEAVEFGLDGALAQLPPRVALAYAILRDSGVGDKGLLATCKRLLVQYLTGETES